MSALSDALNYVLERHTALNPDFASNLLPGLPREQIIEIMKAIVDRVPEELIELYEWRNGGGFYYPFLPSFEFKPLEHAIEMGSYHYHKNNDNWLPIMHCNGDALLIMMFDPNSDISSIYCQDLECGIYEQCFDSLTTMIQTIATCFDEGLYWCDEEIRRVEGRNYDRYCQIHKQYNPNSCPFAHFREGEGI